MITVWAYYISPQHSVLVAGDGDYSRVVTALYHNLHIAYLADSLPTLTGSEAIKEALGRYPDYRVYLLSDWAFKRTHPVVWRNRNHTFPDNYRGYYSQTADYLYIPLSNEPDERE